MRFGSPLAFLVVAIIPLLLLLHWRSQGRAGLRLSSLATVRQAGASLRQRLRALPAFLRVAALALLVVAMARPQEGREQVRDVSRGVAIEMVIDRSGSMGAEMQFGDERMTRLDVVKKVFEEFVRGNKHGLPGRSNDLVGMVAFARYADTLCPLTLSHGVLSRFLESLHLVKRRSEDGTAIGDAIALAAARLQSAEKQLQRQSRTPGRSADYKIKSKVIILLTDGRHNAGKRIPLEAAALAKEWGIKIHAIGVGGQEGVTTIQTLLGPMKFAAGPGLDEGTLRAIAEETGGIYRSAPNDKSLREVYEEIDRLEKSEIESLRYVDYREMFTPFAMSAFCLLGLEIVLASTWFRRIP